MNDYNRHTLVELFKSTGALQFGDFVLASGQKSNYYIDVKKLFLNSDSLDWVSEHIATMIVNFVPDINTIGGVELGAIPLLGAVLIKLRQHYVFNNCATVCLRGLIIRKQAKEHGTKKLIEGDINQNIACSMVLLEDVVTTGESSAKAIEILQGAGIQPKYLCCVVDREQGGREKIESLGVNFCRLTSAQEVIEHARS